MLSLTSFYSLSYLVGLQSADRPLTTGPLAFLSGAAAGVLGTAVTYPFDLLRTRFALLAQSAVLAVFHPV